LATIVAADFGSYVPALSTTPSSVPATYAGGLFLPPDHSVLWGYLSDGPPVIVDTSIQDGGNRARAGTLGVSDTPEPSSMVLLASGAAGMVGYRWRRRKS
jgi:hypothetical protein